MFDNNRHLKFAEILALVKSHGPLSMYGLTSEQIAQMTHALRTTSFPERRFTNVESKAIKDFVGSDLVRLGTEVGLVFLVMYLYYRRKLRGEHERTESRGTIYNIHAEGGDVVINGVIDKRSGSFSYRETGQIHPEAVLQVPDQKTEPGFIRPILVILKNRRPLGAYALTDYYLDLEEIASLYSSISSMSCELGKHTSQTDLERVVREAVVLTTTVSGLRSDNVAGHVAAPVSDLDSLEERLYMYINLCGQAGIVARNPGGFEPFLTVRNHHVRTLTASYLAEFSTGETFFDISHRRKLDAQMREAALLSLAPRLEEAPVRESVLEILKQGEIGPYALSLLLQLDEKEPEISKEIYRQFETALLSNSREDRQRSIEALADLRCVQCGLIFAVALCHWDREVRFDAVAGLKHWLERFPEMHEVGESFLFDRLKKEHNKYVREEICIALKIKSSKTQFHGLRAVLFRTFKSKDCLNSDAVNVRRIGARFSRIPVLTWLITVIALGVFYSVTLPMVSAQTDQYSGLIVALYFVPAVLAVGAVIITAISAVLPIGLPVYEGILDYLLAVQFSKNTRRLHELIEHMTMSGPCVKELSDMQKSELLDIWGN